MSNTPDLPEDQIDTIGDLVEGIRGTKERLVDDGTSRAKADLIRFWFRGQACADWGLVPKGARAENSRTMRAMLHEFRAEASILYDAPPDHDDVRQWLFLMQHYGMPTLLLDWTRSPLTALAFAVELDKETLSDQADLRRDGQHGMLWMLRPGRWNQLTGATRECAVVEAYARALDGLFDLHFDEDAERRLSPCTRGSVTAVEPVFNSRRMMAQQGVFTIHGPDCKPMQQVNGPVHEACLWKLRVPSDRKRALRGELHDLGIQLSSIFPDLDNLGPCVKRRYRSRGGSSAPPQPGEGKGTSVAQGDPLEHGPTGEPAPSDVV